VKDAGDAMAGLARPMQHALNNLIMVLQANMDSVLASLPPEDRASIRLARAAQATREMDTLLRAFLRLGRPAESPTLDSGRFLDSLRPLLAIGTGRPLTAEVAATAATTPPRPAIDMALLQAVQGARALPRTTPAALVLDGLALRMNWALPPDCHEALAAAGVAVEETGAEACTLRLPAAE
jgi:hypothetical protein